MLPNGNGLNMGTKKLKCRCIHAYQDKIHGKQVRVHNLTSGAKSLAKAKCTVCGSIK